MNLVHNLLLFGRVLRGAGLAAGPDRMIDCVDALRFISIGSRSDFYFTTRALLVRRREDIPRFDEAFDFFWRSRDREQHFVEMRVSGMPRRERAVIPLLLRGSGGEGRESPASGLSASPSELLGRKDFAELTAQELQSVQSLIASFAWRMQQRRTRRLRSGRGPRLDFRRSMRRNLRYGGEILEWAERERKLRPRPIVIIADVSRSMELYSRLLLLFTWSLSKALQRNVEAFVFSTRLTRITRELEHRDLDRVLRDVAAAVPDWSGGTRIGEALHAFNFKWARRVLGRGAITIIISDGLDCGDAGRLADEVARLKRSSRRLLWLNPLLGSSDYQPLAAGIRAALPFIDHFLPAYNLDSLEALAAVIAVRPPASSISRTPAATAPK